MATAREMQTDGRSYERDPMKELIQSLVTKADLTDAQAAKVAEVVKSHLAEKLPEELRGPVLAAITGDRVDGAFDMAKSALEGFLK